MQHPTLRILSLLAGMPFLLASSVGNAQPKVPPKYRASPQYVAQLPKYCWAQYVDGSMTSPPYSIVNCGGGMNHFCPALVFMLQAQDVSQPRNERVGAIKHAVNEVNYTLREMKPGCPITADVHAAKDKARILSTIIK